MRCESWVRVKQLSLPFVARRDEGSRGGCKCGTERRRGQRRTGEGSGRFKARWMVDLGAGKVVRVSIRGGALRRRCVALAVTSAHRGGRHWRRPGGRSSRLRGNLAGHALGWATCSANILRVSVSGWAAAAEVDRMAPEGDGGSDDAQSLSHDRLSDAQTDYLQGLSHETRRDIYRNSIPAPCRLCKTSGSGYNWNALGCRC